MRSELILENVLSEGGIRPVWLLRHNGHEEIFGNDVEKAVERIDRIYEEDGDDLKIHIHGYCDSRHIKDNLFAGKPYFKNVANCRTIQLLDDRPREVNYCFPMKEVMRNSFQVIEDLYSQQRKAPKVPTGFKDLDHLTHGLQPSNLIIIAGRPGMGATALGLGIAFQAAVRAKINTLIFSPGLNKEELGIKMLCAAAGVDMFNLKGGVISATDWPTLTRAAGYLSDAPLHVDDAANLSLHLLTATARRLNAEKALGLIVVDSLHHMNIQEEAKTGRRKIELITKGLKALAEELKVPVVVLSKLDSSVELRPDKRPLLADLGAIEGDADLVMFVYRDELYNRADDNPNKGTAEIIIGKHKNGPLGTVKLRFADKYAAFEDLHKDS